MGVETLTYRQQQFLRLLSGDPLAQIFYLSGGTALAGFHLHHRRSDDLDFFTAQPFHTLTVQHFIEQARQTLGASEVRFERLHDRRLFFFDFAPGEMKVEFTLYPFPQLESPTAHKGILVDGLRDIAANKLVTILDRFDPKDFVDLYFICQRLKFGDVKANAEEKFQRRFDPLYIGSELLKAERISALPMMVQPLAIDELREFFTELAGELKREVLD